MRDRETIMILRRTLYLIALMAFAIGLFMQNLVADTIDDQVREISHLLMCPVCQGQTVEESNSNLAEDMRKIIRKKLEEGKSKEEIIAFFVDRYGETILAAPPAKGTNWLLWLLPGFGLVIGGVGIVLFLRKSRVETEKSEDMFKETKAETEREYMEKLDKELKEFDH
ncbi:MAG TPA: cytochrome c-type biogenesis protein [Thermodesulfobacteriota bacterium]|nr:cytochrome c-type biogenesis protein [Thermodesulfobacteriota bacterium]